jgi:hypothetical protein
MAENGGAAERYAKDKNIFSQEALDKMRSPEKLDTVLPITAPISWMGLIAVAVMLFAVVLWSIFGAFTVKADGLGLIMDPSGVVNVTSLSGGKLDKIYVHSGDKVEKGERIAHIEQAQESAATRMAQYGPELATSGRDAMNRVQEYDMRRSQKNAAEYITSSHDGIVDEILVTEGTNVGGGTPICTLRLAGGGKDLKGVLYVPVDKGKRIKPGMTIQLAPNGVDVSQTGSLLGTVRSVSQYPISAQAMQKRLGNDHLVQFILSATKSAVMEVSFDLVKDESSESGYLWTSSVGEHKPVTAGSFCTGSIIIERKPPISKVFHKLSQWLRNR